MVCRKDKRQADQLRPVTITRGFISTAPASTLIQIGQTKVLCVATVELKVPEFLKDSGRGWLTAEYGMLPGATPQRKPREMRIGKVDGRTYEIQRLIGRALRAVTDLELLGEKTIWFDCDVLQADGGTRTAAITGAFISLYDAVRYLLKEELILKNPIRSYVAAVSVGKIDGELLLDLSYEEDSRAEVDFNIVMTAEGKLVELQGTAEKQPFSEDDLAGILKFARAGINELIQIQKKALNL